MREPTYYIEDLRAEILFLRAQRDTLIRQRDMARRMYCQTMAEIVNPYRSPEEIAAGREWNCFNKENTNVS